MVTRVGELGTLAVTRNWNTLRRNIIWDGILHSHCRENLKSYIRSNCFTESRKLLPLSLCWDVIPSIQTLPYILIAIKLQLDILQYDTQEATWNMSLNVNISKCITYALVHSKWTEFVNYARLSRNLEDTSLWSVVLHQDKRTARIETEINCMRM
jgi:hypothetical protein